MSITIQKSTSGAYFTILDSQDNLLRPFMVNDYDFIPDPDGVSFSLEARCCKSFDRFKIIDKQDYRKTINGDTSVAFADFAALRTYILTNFFRNASGGSGSPSWGSITGNILTQGDLQNQFDEKLSLSGGALTGRVYSSYTPATLTDLTRLGDLELIDTVLTGCVTTASGTTATTTAGTWRINNLVYAKGASTSTTIPAQDATLSRYVVIYGTTSNTILGVNGTLSTDPVQPDIPANTVLIDVILITATTVSVVSGGGKRGSGTVTQVIGINTNGFNWSIANSTTVPAITLRLQDATTSQSGQLTSADWNTFNGKQATITVTKGLTKSGNNIDLGGTMGTTGLSITGLRSIHQFGIVSVTSGTASSLTLSATTTSNGGSSLTLNDQAVFVLQYTDPTTFNAWSINGNGLITDNINSKGVLYNADYSSNFTARSLIDKGYADATYATVGGATYTANNGLTLTTGNIALGGALTKNTGVTTGAFSLTMSSTVSGSVGTSQWFNGFLLQSCVKSGNRAFSNLDVSSIPEVNIGYQDSASSNIKRLLFTGSTSQVGIGVFDAVDNVGLLGNALFSISGNPFQYAQYGNVLTSATNGLTSTSGIVELGGSLTGNISENIGSNKIEWYGDNGTWGLDHLMDNTPGGSIITFSASNSAGNQLSSINISAQPTGEYVELFVRTLTASSYARLNRSDGIFTISDGTSSTGAVYADDYSTANSSNPRWLADKGYIDGKISSLSYGKKINSSGYIATLGGKYGQFVFDTGNTDTSEDDLHAYNIQPNVLTNNGDTLEANFGGLFVASATATRRVKMYFGSTSIFDSGSLTTSLSSQWALIATIIEVDSTKIRYIVKMIADGVTLSAPVSVGEVTGLDLTISNILKITGQAASTGAAVNDIVAQISSVYWYPQGD